MLKKSITYSDYNGVQRTEDFYFHLSKAELIDMEVLTPGGYVNLLERLIKENDQIEIIKVFKDLVKRAYGVKSDDGRRFVKSEELTKAFMETEAYSEFYMELATNANAAADFCNGILPADLANDVKKFDNREEVLEKIKELEASRAR